MKLSIVCATFNRALLLDRALATYAKQTLPTSEWEYVLVDDASTDNTREVCAKWQRRGLPLRVLDSATDLRLPKTPGQWRDGCKLRNAASTFAFGEVIVSTHPEIMVPPNALELAYAAVKAQPGHWHTAIPYWLPPCDVDSVEWDVDLADLRLLPGFYDPTWPSPIECPGAPDYRNQNQETRTDWESEVWWAMDMGLWRWMGGFREFEQWGSVDMDFHARRMNLGINTLVIKDRDHSLMVYHQHHDSPRNMELAMEGVMATDYSTREKIIEQGGLYPVYHHGHRERATDGGLGGIMHDHIQRYEWVRDSIDPGSHILDVGCGTGYGSQILQSPWYLGVDLDAESIMFARKTYNPLFGSFAIRSATNLGPYQHVCDAVTCFEVLEHIAEQQQVIDEIHRVLTSKGRLFLSTPQRGATPGTPWDKYMLSRDELLALFDPDKWLVESYYQLRYGTAEVQQGVPPEDAEIQLLIATKP